LRRKKDVGRIKEEVDRVNIVDRVDKVDRV